MLLPRRTGFVSCLLVGSLLIAACGSASDTGTPPAAGQTPQATGRATSPKTPFTAADACSLLTKADVETLTGKKVLDPRKEEVDQLVTCSFGDPAAPQVGGKALSQLLQLSVMTGNDASYYKGADAQVHDAFTQFRDNADSPQPVTGLGDDAYWDGTSRTLSVVKGKFLLDVRIEEGSLDLCRAALSKALERLPR